MKRAEAILFVACAALAAASLGCTNGAPFTCDKSAEGNPPIRYTEGTAVDEVYMSSPWEGELLYFPGGMRYALEHKLAKEPRWVTSYLSFDRGGTTTSSVAQPAGNQVVIVDVNETTVTVANDSCADYWLLVTAGSGAEPAPP
jgi:hypothetical protein